MDMHHSDRDDNSNNTFGDVASAGRYMSSTRVVRMNIPTASPDRARTVKYFSCQPTETFKAKWELTLFGNDSHDEDDAIDSMSSDQESTMDDTRRHHPNLSMVLDSDRISFDQRSKTYHPHHTSQKQSPSPSFAVSEKLTMLGDNDHAAANNNMMQRHAIDTFFDMDILLPEHLVTDEHYDPTCSWVEQIYYDAEDADIIMAEDDENDGDGDGEDIENRPPRQWRRRQRKDDDTCGKTKTYHSALSVHRPPLQEIILESQDAPPRKSLVMLDKKQSFRLMRSLSPPSIVGGRRRSASMTG